MITSSKNALLQKIRFLKDKKYRDETGLYTVEGLKTVKDALYCGVKLETVVANRKCAEELADAICGIDTQIISDDLFKGISDERTPQGVIAICRKPQTEYKNPDGRCLYLDNIQDPANIGAILRTAAACGFTEVYACGGADAYSPKAVRSSMGGVFRVNFYPVDRVKFFSRLTVPVIAADMDGEDIFKFNPPEKFCLVIGNEGRGVDKSVMEKAEFTVCIPMKNGVESLNAAVSAGIIMYNLSK